MDGVEGSLGWRTPGAIFGEVPITLGTPFPGGYRAAQPSRVMQVDLQQLLRHRGSIAGRLAAGRFAGSGAIGGALEHCCRTA
jgi:hypothetical protein